jgi:hypothetical protein
MAAACIDLAHAIKDLLNQVRGSSSYAKTLESQARQLAAAIGSASFSVSEASAMIQALEGFPDETKQVLTEKTTERISAPKAAVASAARPALQDYSNIPNYLTAGQWDILACGASPATKMELLVNAACKLGLKYPTEVSAQVLTSLYLILAKETNISPAVKLETCRCVKKKVKAVSRMLVGPAACIADLPVDPQQLHGAWYEHAFAEADGGPVASRVTAAQLHEVLRTVPMRSSRADATFAVAAAAQPAAEPQPMAMMQQMMAHFFAAVNGQAIGSGLPGLQILKPANPAEQRSAKRLQSKLSVLTDGELQDLQEPEESPEESLAKRRLLFTPPVPRAAAQLALPPLPPAAQPAPPAELPTAAQGIVPRGPLEAAAAIQAALGQKAATTKNAASTRKVNEKPQPKQAASKTQPKPKPAAASKTKPKPKPAAASKTKPVIGLETTRSQYVCRAGFSGAGQCVTMKWGKNQQHATQASAKKTADKWLQQERRKQGLD